MIDCLSAAAWINPQTDFLLLLQNLRIGHLEAWDKFFLSVTVFGEFWLPTIICSIVYWCINPKAGMYLLTLEGFNTLLAHFFKMLTCVYRPWILDNRIQPSSLAIPFARGYSFPSGHSAMSSSVFGGCAFLLRKNKKLVFLLAGLILLVGFSRLWLGVHTPQDVIGGFLIGITLIFGVNFLIEWAEQNKNRYLYLAGIINLLAVLALIYISFFNSYRVDYINGEILVNPQKSIYVTIIVFGYALGLLNGCFLCRRFFPFNPNDVSVKRRIVRGFVGSIGIIVMLKLVIEFVFMRMMNIELAVFFMFLVGISITLIYPILFTKLKK